MMVTAWRMVKSKYAAAAFSGSGAKVAGGRWNGPGVAVVYVSGSASLAMLEMLVHLESEELLKRYVIFEVSFNTQLCTRIDVRDLPRNWRSSPPLPKCQAIGDAWVVKKQTPVLQVPSAIVPGEWNYLLNPGHPDFDGITIGHREHIAFDRRLRSGQ